MSDSSESPVDVRKLFLDAMAATGAKIESIAIPHIALRVGDGPLQFFALPGIEGLRVNPLLTEEGAKVASNGSAIYKVTVQRIA
jgi:hypothetical protein